MTTRQQRRQLERKARKAALKAEKAHQHQPIGSNDLLTDESQPAVRPTLLDYLAPAEEDHAIPPTLATTTRTTTNSANSQHSTGPKTPEGKAQSSRNAIRHGLAGTRFRIFDWENADDYDTLLANLRAEHQPTTQTEVLLVESMAQHFWLAQRALALQDLCFTNSGAYCDQQKELALYLRYGTTHDRAFQKCLAELLKLRATRQKEHSGFVSQQHRQAAELRKQELHEVKLAALKAKSKPQPATVKPAVSPRMCETERPQAPATLLQSPLSQNLAA